MEQDVPKSCAQSDVPTVRPEERSGAKRHRERGIRILSNHCLRGLKDACTGGKSRAASADFRAA